MSSFRQIEANRRNARLSTGPMTEAGKNKSRQNAVRHGLTAETVIDALEDAEDYAAFELAVTADYDVQTAVERELVLRLASVLWRLRRAAAIETGLFKLQANQLLHFRQQRQAHRQRQNIIDSMCRSAGAAEEEIQQDQDHANVNLAANLTSTVERTDMDKMVQRLAVQRRSAVWSFRFQPRALLPKFHGGSNRKIEEAHCSGPIRCRRLAALARPADRRRRRPCIGHCRRPRRIYCINGLEELPTYAADQWYLLGCMLITSAPPSHLSLDRT